MTTPLQGDLALLGLLAERLEDDPEFIAWALARYREQENLLTPDQLAGNLGMTLPQLARLALCKRPRSGVSDFAMRVRSIADFVTVEAKVLANVLRQVELLEQWPAEVIDNGTLSASFLAAARDRVEEPGSAQTSKSELPSDRDTG